MLKELRWHFFFRAVSKITTALTWQTICLDPLVLIDPKNEKLMGHLWWMQASNSLFWKLVNKIKNQTHILHFLYRGYLRVAKYSTMENFSLWIVYYYLQIPLINESKQPTPMSINLEKRHSVLKGGHVIFPMMQHWHTYAQRWDLTRFRH